METKERNFVTLKNLGGEGNLVTYTAYDTLSKAVEALDDLGLCMNWAQLTKAEGNVLTMLVYQGWTYRRTPERYVVLPFDKDCQDFEAKFSDLLRQIFDPFIISNDDVHRSLVSVTPGDDGSNDDCYFITMVLNFMDEKGEMAKEIRESLSKVEDSHHDVSGRVFWLD